MPLLYFGKRFESARTGLCLVGVECDECGCEYFYELARIGSGGAVRPTGSGRPRQLFGRRGRGEAQPAKTTGLRSGACPCPKCNWIDEELVHGYRLGRFRWVGILTLGVGNDRDGQFSDGGVVHLDRSRRRPCCGAVFAVWRAARLRFTWRGDDCAAASGYVVESNRTGISPWHRDYRPVRHQPWSWTKKAEN